MKNKNSFWIQLSYNMKNYADQGGCCCFPVKTCLNKKVIAGKQTAQLAVVFLVRVVSGTLLYCIARFLQNLSTFLGYPRSANQYAWYVAVKALVLSLRSIWCPHWNHMKVNFRITRNNICSIRKHTYFRYTRVVLFDNVPEAICLARWKSIYQEK